MYVLLEVGNWMTTLAAHLIPLNGTAFGVVPLDLPNPGAGQTPPGSEGFIKIMGWAKWAALGLTVVALIVAGAMMGWGRSHGEGQEHGTRVGRVLIGVAIISAAFSLVSALAGA